MSTNESAWRSPYGDADIVVGDRRVALDLVVDGIVMVRVPLPRGMTKINGLRVTVDAATEVVEVQDDGVVAKFDDLALVDVDATPWRDLLSIAEMVRAHVDDALDPGALGVLADRILQGYQPATIAARVYAGVEVTTPELAQIAEGSLMDPDDTNFGGEG